MLSRKQAEHLLDAYVAVDSVIEKDAHQTLREVILDAMCSTSYYAAPSLTQPPDGNLRRPYEIKTCEL